nr:MAG: minor structural protein [Bacteriophage sp.]
MFLLCPKHEDIKSIGNNTHIWRENMRKRMYLQLFEDGTGAGSNGQGGNNAGNGNGNQGNAGETGNQATFSYAQAEEIAQARAERAERSALKSYFQQQGMSEDQVTQAIADYKAQQKKNQPNVTQMQQDLADARNEVQQMKNEKFLASKGVKTDDLDYVLYKVSKMTDEKTSFEKAADKYLKENPRFTSGSGYRVSTSTGNASNGSVENVNATINDAIRSAARR